MNPAVEALFHEYLRAAGDDKTTAAILTLADVLAPSPRTEIVPGRPRTANCSRWKRPASV